MKKLDIGVIVTTLIIVTISCSLAFFAARVVGDPKDINLVAKNVSITFADTSSSIADTTISPGWSNTKTFTITNNSKEDFSYNIVLSDYVNTFATTGYLQYKITSSDGYNINEYLDLPKSINEKDIVIAYMINIPKNSMQTYQVEFRYQSTEEDQSDDMGKVLKGQLTITEGTEKPTLYDKILADNPVRSTRDTFNTTFTSNTTETLFTSTEKNVHNITDTTVYYYAGDVRNNWVKFGGYYWRIIRTNSDGSIRLLYHSTSSEATDAYIGTSKFNTVKNDPMYVGYMYGSSGSLENNRLNTNNSTIKTVIDEWYKNNLNNYNKYLSATAVYCNDRGTSYGSSIYFPAYTRLVTNKTPTYNCMNSKDAFSENNSEAKLTYPIGLMTADEVSFAGGLWLEEAKSWFYKNSITLSSTGENFWWTLTPYFWSGSSAAMLAIRVSTPGAIKSDVTTDEGVIRPVISIKGDNIWKSGDGSATNPYEVVAEPVNTYTVSLSVNNGSGTTTALVEEGKDATFTVTPNSGYKAELETNTCGGTLSGSIYTISSITAGKTCSITFKSDNPFPSGTLAYKIYEKSKTHEDGVYNENGYRYEGSDPNNYIQMEKSDRTTEMWRIIGLFPDGENGENIIRVRKAGYEKAAYDSNSTNHWPNTTLYTTLSSTYSLTNYKNTVNYKMYLGTSNKYNSYVLADYYDMERMLNSKGMAGATSKASYSSETKFTGSVGLMYPSDYGYAVLASDCARTIKPLNYHETTTCYDNNWLYHRTSDFQLLITPIALAANLVSAVSTKGYVTLYGDFVTDSGLVAPVMALKSDVVVTGSGTNSDPYIMQ